ncbi:MAG TPA: hypothetical protein VI299_28905 [Polyangiales bacterium]
MTDLLVPPHTNLTATPAIAPTEPLEAEPEQKSEDAQADLRLQRRVAIGVTAFALAAALTLAALDHTLPMWRFAEAADALVTNPAVSDRRTFCYLQLRMLQDAANQLIGLRYAVVTFGGVMMLIGTLLTITGLRAAYRITAKHMDGSVALRTSSPGLVLVTLSLIVILVPLWRTQALELSAGELCIENAEGAAAPPPTEQPVVARRPDRWTQFQHAPIDAGAENSEP